MDKELIDKAYKSISGCCGQFQSLIKRLKSLNEFLEKNGYISEEHQIPYEEVESIDRLCFKTFNQYSTFYPELENEWISINLGQIKVSTVKELEIHFTQKKMLLENILHRLNADTKSTESKSTTNNYYGNVYNVEKAEVVGENNNIIKINELNYNSQIELANQLQKVIEYLKQGNLNIQPHVIENLSNAKKELENGNDNKFKSFLKSAGKWALDASTKVGTGLLTAYLKNANGL